MSREWRLQRPDDVLLRRFGHVRAVGGFAWIAVVVVLTVAYGWEAWPLALGVPVLGVVTTLYFVRSARYPRTMVTVSLVADAIVLAGAIAFFGGTGSGLILLYAIVVVSAGLLLGPLSAYGFTVLGLVLAFGQLGLEQLGVTPRMLHRTDFFDRIAVLLASCAGLISVGYLAATYASRLHELVALAGVEADEVRARGHRRRGYVHQARQQVRRRLNNLEQLAESLDRHRDARPSWGERASRLRLEVSELEAAVEELVDVAAIDGVSEMRPQPVELAPVVDDCLQALSGRLAEHHVTTDLPHIKVVANTGTLRRIVFNLLENLADHTPPGTRAHIAARTGTGQCLLVVTDDGPGIPPETVSQLFDPPDDSRHHVGLPLVRELCEVIGGTVRCEAAPSGGARVIVTLRQAPTGAPASREELEARMSTEE